MANKNFPNVKIISECFIRPKCELEQSKNPHYLTASDLFQLSTNYSFRGLLFAKPSSLTSINSLVEKLKHSLSVALVDFYPLAGRLETTKYDEDHASWVYVDCNKGPGAIFIHATTTQESNNKVSVLDIVNQPISLDLSGFFYGDDSKILNYDGHTRPLVSVQVTDLVDGVFIGFTMNHALGDGTSFVYFINALSKIFMREEGLDIDIEKPIFRPVFPDGYGPIIKLPYLDPSEFITRYDSDPRVRMRVFNFSAESIARLKAQANTENNSTNTISSFNALSAFVWLSITRARKLPIEAVTDCWLPADIRRRSDPPLSPNHFGNLAHMATARSKVKELDSNGLGWAAMLVHKAIMGLDNKVMSDFWRALSEYPQVAHASSFFGESPPLIFTESIKFDTYGPQFGLGKALALRAGRSTWMDGRIIMDPGREGGGSASLQIGLLSDTMAALESDDKFNSYVS